MTFVSVVLFRGFNYLITEFLDKGSMGDYLKTQGHHSISKKDQIKFARYAQVKQILQILKIFHIFDNSDTCAGMKYLETKKIVHRNLTAR